MSVLFLKQLRIHREQLQKKLGDRAPVVEQEIAQARQFLTSTKDPKWKGQLLKRIRRLEEARKTKPNRADIEKRLKAVNEIYDLVQAHPDYNKTRKRRTTK